MSHGSAGVLDIGSSSIDFNNLNDKQQSSLSFLRGSLTNEADILVYGCEFGQDLAAIDTFANLTGADIAASNDLTGHDSLVWRLAT